MLLSTLLFSLAAFSAAQEVCLIDPSPGSDCVVPEITSCAPDPPRETSCADVHIIVTRGTTECCGAGNGVCVAGKLQEKLESEDYTVNIDYTPYAASFGGKKDKPCAGTATKNPFYTSDVHKLKHMYGLTGEHALDIEVANNKSYIESEAAGTNMLGEMIMDYLDVCNTSKIVLIGYSQGAQVVADVLYGTSEDQYQYFWKFQSTPPLDYEDYGSKVAAVALFGDPSFVPEMKGNYGTYSKDGRSKGGWFPRSSLDAAVNYENITRSYCDALDTFCDCGVWNKGAPLAQVVNCGKGSRVNIHQSYIYCQTYLNDSVEFIFDKIPPRDDDWSKLTSQTVLGSKIDLK